MRRTATRPCLLLALVLASSCGRSVILESGADGAVAARDGLPLPTLDSTLPPPPRDGAPIPPRTDGSPPPPALDGPPPRLDGSSPPPPLDAAPPPPFDGAPPPPPPDAPDLVIASLQAVVGNGNVVRVRYEARVCNVGLSASPAASATIYHDRVTAPHLGETGDQQLAFPALNPGACTTRRTSWWGAPSGTYASWALVDPYNTIAERNEGNNVAGPVAVVVGTPALLSCTSICAVALVCGVFSPLQYTECISWCGPLDAAAQRCLSDAVRANDCAGLSACAPLPPPPPPPAPGVCDDLCQWFVGSCNVIAGLDSSVCLATCQQLPPASVSCVQNARAANDCQAALGCLF